MKASLGFISKNDVKVEERGGDKDSVNNSANASILNTVLKSLCLD